MCYEWVFLFLGGCLAMLEGRNRTAPMIQAYRRIVTWQALVRNDSKARMKRALTATLSYCADIRKVVDYGKLK